jgi:Rrf2 family protein
MTFIARNMPESTSAMIVSQEMKVPYKFSEAILNMLKREGLLVSMRGKYGGYRLSRAASEITMLDILTAIEGEVCFLPCVNHSDACEFSDECGPHQVWVGVQDCFKNHLETSTLAQLATMSACAPPPLEHFH